MVLFDDDYEVHRCVSVPRELIQEHAKYRSHVNGHAVGATDILMDDPSVEDLTAALRRLSAGSQIFRPTLAGPPEPTRAFSVTTVRDGYERPTPGPPGIDLSRSSDATTRTMCST